MISVNKKSQELVEDLIKNQDYYRVNVKKGPNGCTLIDAGVNALGLGHDSPLSVTGRSIAPIPLRMLFLRKFRLLLFSITRCLLIRHLFSLNVPVNLKSI